MTIQSWYKNKMSTIGVAESKTKNRRLRSLGRSDLFLSIVLVAFFMGLAQWKSMYPQSLPWLNRDFRHHIGAEYNDIALAIRKGRGFSDPFRCESGPTAWMPPVLPYLMAGIYWLEGDRPESMAAWMIAMQGVSTWCAAFLLLREARRLGQTVAGVVIAIVVFTANFYQLFQQTHDTALLLLVISLLWWGLIQLTTERGGLRNAMWGIWGGFCTLCSPIIGATWMLCSLSILRPKRLSLREGKSLVVVLGLWLVVISPWMIRNRMQFGKWFPIKPNGAYELWQSHCKDEDGILDAQSGFGHPWSIDGEQRVRYQQVGEIAFIDEKGAEVRKSILENPLGFIERIGNRAVAALIYYVPFSHMEEIRSGGWPVFYARCVHPLPVLSIAVIAVIGTIPVERKVAITVSMFALLLMPYILVSYYDRYAAILAGIKMLLILYGWSELTRFSRSRSLSRGTNSVPS
jgi:hypothetical protein